MRWVYAIALYRDAAATLDDLHEAMTTLEDARRIALRVFGGAYPLTVHIEDGLREGRATLRARKTMASDDDDEISREELAKALGCTVEELDG